MPRVKDPTDPIRKKAAAFPAVASGTACTQSSFKTDKGSFLYVGPGAKGQGFKAMFKLERSLPQARKLAAGDPARFEVGSTHWVTTRFTEEKPLPPSIWEKWLQESYDLTCDPVARGEPTARKKVTGRKPAKKKTTRKS